jgi:hypothetical protein
LGCYEYRRFFIECKSLINFDSFRFLHALKNEEGIDKSWERIYVLEYCESRGDDRNDRCSPSPMKFLQAKHPLAVTKGGNNEIT